MGKNLKGRELGKGITQRKDGRYQARYTNRFGKRQTVYSKNLSEIRNILKEEQKKDSYNMSVREELTLDEWFTIWLDTCKSNCRDSTKQCYRVRYNRIKEELGWRKLTSLNLILLQRVFNDLGSDKSRKDTKITLVDMLNKAVDSELLSKNIAKQINTVVSPTKKEEQRVLTKKETDLFLKYAKGTFYYNLYVLALETGMRVGELLGLQWSDINFDKKYLLVSHTMVYYSKNGKYVHELHDPKTKNGIRKIPLTQKAMKALTAQRIQKNEICLQGKIADEKFENLVFVTKNNKPAQHFLIQQSIELILAKMDGFKYFTTHTFRHTFATRAIENGMQPKTLQKILGHGTLAMTMDLYCHTTDDILFSEMGKMESKVCKN